MSPGYLIAIQRKSNCTYRLGGSNQIYGNPDHASGIPRSARIDPRKEARDARNGFRERVPMAGIRILVHLPAKTSQVCAGHLICQRSNRNQRPVQRGCRRLRVSQPAPSHFSYCLVMQPNGGDDQDGCQRKSHEGTVGCGFRGRCTARRGGSQSERVAAPRPHGGELHRP